MSGQAAIDLAWTMTSPRVYEQLMLDRGWTPDQYQDWPGAALPTLILAD